MNFNEVKAMKKAFQSVKERQRLHAPGDMSEKIEKLKTVRESSVGNRDMLARAVDRARRNGFRVFMAEDKDEAVGIILRETGDEQLVIKSKSNVTREIGLASALEARGIAVIETDIGDRILQVLQTAPSHPTGPVSHISASTMAEKLADYHHVEIGQTPAEVVNFVREEIRSYMEKAQIGITGANAVTAEEGSVVLVHNEGNIFQVMRKKKHIIVTAIDKIYPSVEDALNMIKVVCFKATGSLIPSFVEIMSGVSKTADVEKQFLRGVHAPNEVVLILLDNKRTEMVEKGFRELLSCIDCGNCLLHCPIYNTVGTYFAEEKYLGGKGLAYKSLSEEEVNKKLEFCLTCEQCRKHCPLSIDVPGMIRSIRSESLPGEIYYFLKSHLLWLYYVARLKLS
ncbi:MAG: LUD domain-containing protein [Nitrospirota bacterium]